MAFGGFRSQADVKITVLLTDFLELFVEAGLGILFERTPGDLTVGPDFSLGATFK